MAATGDSADTVPRAAPARELPESLTSVLRHAWWLEHLAVGLHRERRAIAATSAILLAAFEAGWQQRELAAFLGMNRQAVQYRIMAARRTYGDARPAIVVDLPLDRPPHPLSVLKLPVTERAWLTVSEAAAHASVDRATIRNWDRRGALPNTDRSNIATYLYLRADLDRLTTGPHRGRRGCYPDFDRLLEQISAAAI